MSDDRIARALLRLYPRTWRARYGDEFLALIADTGLTWRAAIDVVGAASVERARVLIALWRGQAGPEATLKTIGPANARELFVEAGALLTLIALTVLALGLLGVPWPWSARPFGVFWTLYVVLFSSSSDGRLPRPASGFDRVALSFGQFVGAMLIVAGAYFVAAITLRLGIASPPENLVFLYVIGVPLAGGGRLAYRALRGAYRSFRSPGYIDGSRIGAREVMAWNAALFATLVLLGTIAGGEAYWMMTYCCFGWLGMRRSARYMRAVATTDRQS
jgi:hypothetical protein